MGSTPIKIRFRISFLLFVIAIASIALAYWSHQNRRQEKIAAAVPLIAAINRGNNGNPATIVTALNELKQLGHTDALEALRRFDLEHSHKPQNVEIMVQFLFERTNTGEKFPSMALGDTMDFALDRDNWQSNFEFIDGIPFDTNVFPNNYSGFIYSRAYAIKWADERGRLNNTPLIPTDTPFKTSDKLIQKIIVTKTAEYIREDRKFLDEIPERTTNRIQEQVYQMVEHLVPEFETPQWRGWASRPDLWQKLQSECLNRGLRWSSDHNRYIFTK